MSPTLTFCAVAATHPGHVRPVNQDQSEIFAWHYDDDDRVGLLVVADGMGGHRAGEVASRLAVDALETGLNWPLLGEKAAALAQPTLEDPEPILDFLQTELRHAIQAANLAILSYAIAHAQEAGDLGTTLTAALLCGSYATVANVGDSRTYHWRQGRLSLITQDHSYVGHLVRSGQLTSAAVYDHPQRHLITRSLGQLPGVEIDFWSFRLQPGDRLLLCSDGLWEMIRDSAELCAYLETDSVEQAAVNLVNAANQYGGLDNISAIVAELLVA